MSHGAWVLSTVLGVLFLVGLSAWVVHLVRLDDKQEARIAETIRRMEAEESDDDDLSDSPDAVRLNLSEWLDK